MSVDRKVIKNRIRLLELARQLCNVSHFGYSRDSFYRCQGRYETGGEAALADVSKKKPLPKNRVPEGIEEAVVQLALEKPVYG